MDPGEPCPRVFPFAQGAQFSVTKEQIRARPPAFFQGLLDDGLNSRVMTHQSFQLETAWPYLFFSDSVHPTAREDEFCPRDIRSYPVTVSGNRDVGGNGKAQQHPLGAHDRQHVVRAVDVEHADACGQARDQRTCGW